MSNLVLTRKVGIEMEGYIYTHPEDVEISGVRITNDESLKNYEWDYDYEPYGVELKTPPVKDLTFLYGVFKEMLHLNWDVDGLAGTHVHVDVSDFDTKEKVKLLRFGKGIEPIIFLFVEDYRFNNEYCEPVHDDWAEIFDPNGKYVDIDWNSIKNPNETDAVNIYLLKRFFLGEEGICNSKYQWMNVFESHFPTCEFRLFHAVENIEELIKQTCMAEAIVNLVKHSSAEQLEFIIREIYKQDSFEKTIEKFFDVLALDFTLPVKCIDAKYELLEKIGTEIGKELVTV